MSTSARNMIARFAHTHLNSMEALQVFVACSEDRDRWWDARTMSRRVGIRADAVVSLLDQLARTNLLDIRVTDEVRYRFRPGSPQLQQEAETFVDAYRRHPQQVADLIRGDKNEGPAL